MKSKSDSEPEQKFRSAMQQILAVPKTEILKREAEYKKKRSSGKKQR